MYITYQNKICIPLQALFESGIIQSEGTYRTLRNRGHLKVERSGFDKTKTYINAVQMRPDIKEKVIAAAGPLPDNSLIPLADHIEWDKEAETIFREYRYNEDKSLDEDIITEYTITVGILNAFKSLFKSHFSILKITKNELWTKLSEATQNLNPEKYPHRLPANAQSLRRKYAKYIESGPKSIIHKNFGNESSVKLTAEAKEWALARWCNQVNRCANLAQLHEEFNETAADKGWKTVADEKTFYNFIYDPKTEPLWWAHRYGEKAADLKYGYQHTTILPTRRDSLWYSDGTKLNFYYIEDGKMKSGWVYEVMDAFSEVFLGFHISKDTENFQDQYKAYKMAIQFAGHRPYEIKFDNQGGHKKLIASEFFAKISRLAICTKPYNGRSKTIESAFGRFQKQTLKKCWFFTGQNVTAKTQESKTNMEFIQANKMNLPTYEEAISAYTELRDEWNNAAHFQTGISRMEMYRNSHNEKTPETDIWDMVNMFWVWHSQGDRLRPITFTPGGISFEINKQRYEYMVYDENGLPDQSFIDRAVNDKFYLKYDPEMMDEIYLYKEDHRGKRFVTNAKLKLEIHRATQDQSAGENSFIQKVAYNQNTHRQQRFAAMEEILENHGVAAWQQGFNTPKIKGAYKSEKSTINQSKKTARTATTVEADFDKQISNLTQNDIYEQF